MVRKWKKFKNPWITSCLTLKLLNFMNCVRFVKYLINQSKFFPLVSLFSNLKIKILWLTVSKLWKGHWKRPRYTSYFQNFLIWSTNWTILHVQWNDLPEDQAAFCKVCFVRKMLVKKIMYYFFQSFWKAC